MSQGHQTLVVASFHQTLWNCNPVSSGTVRARNMGTGQFCNQTYQFCKYSGWVFGNDVVRFYHGTDEVLTIPENWSDHPQYK
jgi:hypothetical protein